MWKVFRLRYREQMIGGLLARMTHADLAPPYAQRLSELERSTESGSVDQCHVCCAMQLPFR